MIVNIPRDDFLELNHTVIDAAGGPGALADLVTAADNPFFARATVNRLWFHLLGKGIVDPPDDFRDSNPSANDALLDALAKDFVDHKFDMKMKVLEQKDSIALSADGHGGSLRALGEQLHDQ